VQLEFVIVARLAQKPTTTTRFIASFGAELLAWRRKNASQLAVATFVFTPHMMCALPPAESVASVLVIESAIGP